MIRSLWSGVAGLKTHQLKMDVIGNNVANVNTTSYKSQQTTFGDLLYQTSRMATGANAVRGGTNARQVGLGAKTSAIMTNVGKQGSIQQTDNALDVAIAGDSFFVVENARGELNYTRDGSFSVDANGYLVTRSDGYYVRGTQAEGAGAGTNGRIQILPLDEEGNMMNLAGEPTTYARITGNISRTDKMLTGESGRTIEVEVYGNDGDTYTVKFRFTNAGDDDDTTYGVTVAGVYDSDHNLIENGVAEDTNVALKYDPSTGAFVSANGAENGQVQIGFQGGAAAAGTITFDFSETTNYAPLNGMTSSKLEAHRGDVEENMAGYPEGKMTGFAIARDGTITRFYNNGQDRFVGRIVVAEFANVTGLSKEGENLYAATGNSGDADMMFVTDDGGYMESGSLEMSNVDLSTEFTDMITTQRGFQANSRVITVSDTLLDELRSLKR